MRLPPPIRITAPLVALIFGLVATWFDYRLNLDLDLARHLRETNERADSSGTRLARQSERLLVSGDSKSLQAVVEAIPDVPEVHSPRGSFRKPSLSWTMIMRSAEDCAEC